MAGRHRSTGRPHNSRSNFRQSPQLRTVSKPGIIIRTGRTLVVIAGRAMKVSSWAAMCHPLRLNFSGRLIFFGIMALYISG